MKAILESSLIEELQPFVGKNVWMKYSKTFSGPEPVLYIYRLGMVTKVQNPLLTYLPLWLDPAQQGLFGELVRLVNLLEAPYRNLVQPVYRDEQAQEAFLDWPASHAVQHGIPKSVIGVYFWPKDAPPALSAMTSDRSLRSSNASISFLRPSKSALLT